MKANAAIASEDYREVLMSAAILGFQEGRTFDEVYDKCWSIIPRGFVSGREIKDLINIVWCDLPESETGDEEMESPETIEPVAKYQVAVPEKPHDDELKRLEERLKTPNLDDDEVAELLREIKFIKLLQRTHNVADLLIEPPTEPDQIFTDFLDVGDKLAIIAPTKMKKSLLMLSSKVRQRF